ncbi:MAG TPA: NAD-dependent epimerase/dehydratase family protein [Bacillales bacterium]|nr:NAD-dependent epimerase/dehydratase family protein [Bacillales bacterium]
MKKAVVTEALGFIGFHLCDRLLEEGIEVTAIDNLANGRNKEEKENKLDYFGRNALFDFHDGEVKDISMRQPFKEADVCFCLTPCFLQEEEEMHTALHDAFENVRIFNDETANENNPVFILASSTDIYGRVSGEIEESEIISPITMMGMMAVVHESLLDFRELPLLVLRLPEIYGPGQPSAGSLHQLLQGETPSEAPLDLLYVKDAIEAFIGAAQKPVTGTYNIASGRSNQWKMAKDFIKGEGLSTGEDKSEEIRFCIDKARNTFGFQPRTSLEEGIEEQRDS